VKQVQVKRAPEPWKVLTGPGTGMSIFSIYLEWPAVKISLRAAYLYVRTAIGARTGAAAVKIRLHQVSRKNKIKINSARRVRVHMHANDVTRNRRRCIRRRSYVML
jgi:hypothetical protein